MTQSIRDAAQPTADERVAEHMLRLSELLHAYGQVRWLNMDHSPGVSQADEDAAFDAVISHARALLSASQEDAEHAAMYRWLREQHESSDSAESFCVFAPVPAHSLEPVGIMPGELDASIRSAMSFRTSGDKVKTDKTDEVIDVVMQYMPGLIETVAMSVNAGYGNGNGPGVVSMVKSIEHAIRMTLEEPLPWSVASAAMRKTK